MLCTAAAALVAAACATTAAVTAPLKPGDKGTVTHGSVTMRKADVPSDAAPYYPWTSVEDFFENSGLRHEDLSKAGVQKCSSPYPGRVVYTVSDGHNERCFVAIKSASLHTAAPVLFLAHGSGGSAYQCGALPDSQGTSWVDVAIANNFNLVCGEAVQSNAVNNITGKQLTGGIWTMPEVFNDSSGRHCGTDELENAYMAAVWEKMGTVPDQFDLSRTFITGCSQGSAFAQWQSVCKWTSNPSDFTAFAASSTGLKVKGDGNNMPPSPSGIPWGECATCKYWPTVPGKFTGLKACIYDQTADPNAGDPFFYRTSVQMAKYYKQYDSPHVATYTSGGHCQQHSFDLIAQCMDDGTKRLLNPSGCADTPPDSNYTCAQQKSFGKCTKPWMNGYCCKTCFDCSATCSN